MEDVKTQIEQVTEIEKVETAEQRAKRHLKEINAMFKSDGISLYSYVADETKGFKMVKVGLSFGKPTDEVSCSEINEQLFEFVELFKDVDDVFIEFDSCDTLSKTKYAINELVPYPSSIYGSEYEGYRRCILGIDSSKNSLNVRLTI